MAEVFVTTTNNRDHEVTLRLDDERDAERIEYLRTLVRREDLKAIKVEKPAARKAAAKPAAKPEQ